MLGVGVIEDCKRPLVSRSIRLDVVQMNNRVRKQIGRNAVSATALEQHAGFNQQAQQTGSVTRFDAFSDLYDPKKAWIIWDNRLDQAHDTKDCLQSSRVLPSSDTASDDVLEPSQDVVLEVPHVPHQGRRDLLARNHLGAQNSC